MVVNALCQIFVNRKLDKIFGNNFFSSIIRSGLLESFSFEHCPEKGAKCSVYSITITQKHSPAKHFFGTQSRRSGPVPILLLVCGHLAVLHGGREHDLRPRPSKMLQLADKLVELNGV